MGKIQPSDKDDLNVTKNIQFRKIAKSIYNQRIFFLTRPVIVNSGNDGYNMNMNMLVLDE